jgi:hypothetical protein
MRLENEKGWLLGTKHTKGSSVAFSLSKRPYVEVRRRAGRILNSNKKKNGLCYAKLLISLEIVAKR